LEGRGGFVEFLFGPKGMFDLQVKELNVKWMKSSKDIFNKNADPVKPAT
jgi:hypothetical protein